MVATNRHCTERHTPTWSSWSGTTIATPINLIPSHTVNSYRSLAVIDACIAAQASASERYHISSGAEAQNSWASPGLTQGAPAGTNLLETITLYSVPDSLHHHLLPHVFTQAWLWGSAGENKAWEQLIHLLQLLGCELDWWLIVCGHYMWL